MEFYYQLYLADMRRRQEEIEFAYNYRLMKTIPIKLPIIISIYHRWMLKLGELLVDWGYRLLCRYETFVVEARKLSETNPGSC